MNTKMKTLTTNLFFILIAGFILTSCSQEPIDITAEIQKANEHFSETFKSGDAQAMAELYTKDGVLFPPNSPALRGSKKIKTFWEGTFEAGITDAKLVAVSALAYGNIAIEEGEVTIYVGDLVVGEEKYIVIWHKENGQWKLHQDMFNSNWPKPDNVSTVQKVYDAFALGDIPAVLAQFDDKIIWNEAENFPYADGNPYIGPDAVLNGVFARIGAEWEYWKLTEMSLSEMGTDQVFASGRYDAKNKKTGKKINAQFVHVWTVEEGKATGFQQHTDTKQVARAVK